MKKKSAQDIQDEIFKKMSADKKLKIASGLWQLAKLLAKNKLIYEPNRPKKSISKNR